MNPSYVRIRVPLEDALARFSRWIALPELGPPEKVTSSRAVDRACRNGIWRSVVAVYVYESGQWTVFDDLTGHLASFSSDRWREFAGGDDLVFAGYNDSVPYGQVILIQSGQVLRDFLDDQQDPRQNINRGRLAFENTSPIDDWIGAASFVDQDETVRSADEGLLWMLGATA